MFQRLRGMLGSFGSLCFEKTKSLIKSAKTFIRNRGTRQKSLCENRVPRGFSVNSLKLDGRKFEKKLAKSVSQNEIDQSVLSDDFNVTVCRIF